MTEQKKDDRTKENKNKKRTTNLFTNKNKREMKTRTLFVTALLGLGMMASCSNDELEGMNNGQNPDGKAYAQIAINVANSATTRAIAGATGSEEPGTEAESKVSTVTVVLADPASDIAQYVYNFPGDGTLDLGTNTADFATSPFLVPAGKYHVYVLANFGDNGLSISSINPGFDMKQEIAITAASKLSTDNSFLMTNGGVLGKVSEGGDGYGQEFNFEGTASDKEVNGDLTEKEDGKTLFKVEVQIERVVSKVTFNNTDNQSFTVEDANGKTLATATLNGVDLINLNKKMYLIREAKTTTHKPSGVSTWYYPVDPNYNKLTSTELTSNFSDNEASDFTAPASATFYCPENTMTAEAQLNGQTTGVVYQITWALNTDAGNNPYTELSQGGTDTYSQIFAAILSLSSGKDTDINENIFKADLAEGTTDGTFYAYNDLIFKNKNAAILYYCIANATGADNSAKASDANTDFGTNKSETDLSKLSIKEYKGGVNYYPVWIKHNPDGSNMQQDKFGVVRNHWYELTVTGISNLGNDKPKFENPDDPDDPAVANIQVAAKIKKWTVVKQNVEL